MKVEIRLQEGCPEPHIILVADHMTRELESLVKQLQQKQNFAVAGFQGSQAVLLEPKHILRLYAGQGKVFAGTMDGNEYVIKARLYELEARLASEGFVRISNSELVNLRQIKGFDLSLSGTIRVTLSDGQTTYVSRRYMGKIKEQLGI